MDCTGGDISSFFNFDFKNIIPLGSIATLFLDKDECIRREVETGSEYFPPTQMERMTRVQIEETCSQSGILFIDTTFPPNNTSLFKTNQNPNGLSNGENLIVWKRPNQFLWMGETCVLYGDSIQPCDVNQGQLGDCWLLCSLASLAEFPHLVENLFLGKSASANEAGVYKVQFCKNGRRIGVIVDDYFPCHSYGGLIYSRGRGPELWVSLVEKAYAKLHGSYSAIENGLPYEAMMDLTGAPYKNFRIADADVGAKIADGSLWDYLCSCDRRKYIMSCETPGKDAFSKTGETPVGGLVPGHAYTLLECLSTVNGGHRLCKVRNPWGKFEWDGDWSDSSPLWTPELKEEVRLENSNDGIFWISFEDLVKHFTGINICMTRSGDDAWKEWRCPFEYHFSKSGLGLISVPIYSLEVQRESVELVLTIHQTDERIVGAPKYIDCGITLLRPDGSGHYEYVASVGNNVERQNQLEIPSLPAGFYIAVPTSGGVKIEQLKTDKIATGEVSSDVSNEDMFSRPAVLSIHCSHADIILHEMPYDPLICEEADSLPAVHDGQPRNLVADNSIVLYSWKSGYDGSSYVVKNNDPYMRVCGVTIDLSGSNNIVTQRGDIGASQVEVFVPPGSARLVHHIVPKEFGQGWSTTFKSTCRWLSMGEGMQWYAADSLEKQRLTDTKRAEVNLAAAAKAEAILKAQAEAAVAAQSQSQSQSQVQGEDQSLMPPAPTLSPALPQRGRDEEMSQQSPSQVPEAAPMCVPDDGRSAPLNRYDSQPAIDPSATPPIAVPSNISNNSNNPNSPNSATVVSDPATPTPPVPVPTTVTPTTQTPLVDPDLSSAPGVGISRSLPIAPMSPDQLHSDWVDGVGTGDPTRSPTKLQQQQQEVLSGGFANQYKVNDGAGATGIPAGPVIAAVKKSPTKLIDDVIPICGMCCCIAECGQQGSNLSLVGFVSCVLTCLELDLACCKRDPRQGFSLSQCAIVGNAPVTILKGTSQCCCFNTRCSLPNDDEVPCLINLCGLNCFLEGSPQPLTVGGSYCLSVRDMRTAILEAAAQPVPSADGSAVPAAATAVVGSAGYQTVSNSISPAKSRRSDGIKFSFQETFSAAAADFIKPLVPLDTILPCCGLGCCLLSETTSMLANATMLVSLTEGLKTYFQCAVTCFESTVLCCRSMPEGNSGGKGCTPYTLIVGNCNCVVPMTLLKGTGKICCWDVRCSMPADKDTPYICSGCGNTCCISFLFPPVKNGTIGVIRASLPTPTPTFPASSA